MALLAEDDHGPFPKITDLSRRQSWRGLAIPSWNRLGSQNRGNGGSSGSSCAGGNGEEILTAMKEVNRSQQSFVLPEEVDEVEAPSDERTPAMVCASGRNREYETNDLNDNNTSNNGDQGTYFDNNNHGISSNYNNYTYSINYGGYNNNMHSAPIQLASGNYQHGFSQNHHSSKRYSYHYHHHHHYYQQHQYRQQHHRDSVSSMQQFYYSPSGNSSHGDSYYNNGYGYGGDGYEEGYRYRSSGYHHHEHQRQAVMLQEQTFPSVRTRRLSEPPRPGPRRGYTYHQRRQQQLHQYNSELPPPPLSPPHMQGHGQEQQQPRPQELGVQQSHRTPIIHKTIAKLTGQSLHHHSGSSTSFSSASLSCSSPSSSSLTLVSNSHSRTATSLPYSVASAQPPHHYSSPSSSATTLATPSPPSSITTLTATPHDSPSAYTTLKLMALNHSLASPTSADTAVIQEQQRQLGDQQELQEQNQCLSNSSSQSSMSRANSTCQTGDEQERKGKRTMATITVETQLSVMDTMDKEATTSSSSSSSSLSPNSYLPASNVLAPPSAVMAASESTTSIAVNPRTTAQGRRETFDQGHGGEEADACCSCAVPDLATFKAGLLPTSKQAREVLLATVILALVTIALEAILLQRHKVMTETHSQMLNTEDRPFEVSFFRPLKVYYSIFILAEVFAVGLLWDAAIHKNSLQLVAFTVFEWCMVSYSGLQIWQYDQLAMDIANAAKSHVDISDSNTRVILFSQLGVQVVACLGITLLTWRLYSEFGWLVFQKLGADVSLRRMMKEYRMLFTLLKLDAFFFLGYAIQIAALTDKEWQKGLIEVAFAIPLSAAIILLGFCALRNENKVTMGGFITCLALLIGYMIYRLVALWQTLTGDPTTDPYFFSRKTMTVFAGLTLFMTILALINAVVMLYNFNKGLKEAMQQYRIRRSGTVRSTTGSIHRVSVNGSGILAIGMPGGHDLASSGNWGGGGAYRTRRNSRQTSRRSLVHYEVTTPAPVMSERWEIE